MHAFWECEIESYVVMFPNSSMPVVTTKERTLRGLACKTMQEAAMYLYLNNEYFAQVVSASTNLVAARKAIENFITDSDQVLLNLRVSFHQEMGDTGIKVLEALMAIEEEFLNLPSKEVELQSSVLKRIIMNINNAEVMKILNKTQEKQCTMSRCLTEIECMTFQSTWPLTILTFHRRSSRSGTSSIEEQHSETDVLVMMFIFKN